MGVSRSAKSQMKAAGAAPIFGCRAWINFDGSTATPTIRASGNVSSITDNGVGDYTLNFSSALPDANFAVAGMGSFTATNTRMVMSADSMVTPFSAGSARIKFVDSTNGTMMDPVYSCIAVFR